MTWSGEAKEKLLLVSVCFFWKRDGGGGWRWLKPFFFSASRAPRFLTKPTQQEVNKLFAAFSILPPGWDASLNSPSQCYYPLPHHLLQQDVTITYLFTWAKRGTSTIIIILIIYYSILRNSCCPKYIKLIIIKIVLMKMYIGSSFKKVYYRKLYLEKKIAG